jgi:phage shock protein E
MNTERAVSIAALLLITAYFGPAAADDAAPGIAPTALEQRVLALDADLLVLDVRTPEEYASGHVPGARNIPYDRIEESLPSLESARQQDVVVYCRSGRRAAVAIAALEKAGFEHVRHLEGDMLGWQDAQLPVQADVPETALPVDSPAPEPPSTPPPQ